MKKKIIIAISIIFAVILLIPLPMRLKDGGTVKYQAILYSISDVHRLGATENDVTLETGIIVEILGLEVFNNVATATEKLSSGDGSQTNVGLDETMDYAAPAHFYLDGKGYIYHGKLVYELPDGFEYIGDVINVGNTFSGKDFEGNVDGKIYMSESVSDFAYFSWAEWDEDVDGPAPFLKLELDS